MLRDLPHFRLHSFIVVGMFNNRTIQKTKIIDMLAADRKNDPELKRGRWIVIAAVLFELFTIWMAVTGVQKVWFYYDSRFALPVKVMFWGKYHFAHSGLALVCMVANQAEKIWFFKMDFGIVHLLRLECLHSSQCTSLNQSVLSPAGGRHNQSIFIVCSG